MSNELSKPAQPFRPAVKLVGLAAKRAAATAKEGDASTFVPPKPINPLEALHRIGIVFDDSISMSGTQIINARAGVTEFLRSCVPNQTSVAIYPFKHKPLELSSELPAIAQLVQSIGAECGGTYPMRSLNDMLRKYNLTRCIIFSDGSPSDSDRIGSSLCTETIALAIEQKIPVDTVFLGIETKSEGIYSPDFYMKQIAEKTGGLYLCFDPGKSNFATAFKYLSPGFRGMLADKSFVDKIQNGGV